jgi:hypothetical protein
MKNILVLCENLKYFGKWSNTIINWYATTNYKKMGSRLDIEVEGECISYRAFTPQMSKEVLRGGRFDDIIDNVGLSGNERMWFNALIRPEAQSDGVVEFKMRCIE